MRKLSITIAMTVSPFVRCPFLSYATALPFTPTRSCRAVCW